jgi:hypothetical protein
MRSGSLRQFSLEVADLFLKFRDTSFVASPGMWDEYVQDLTKFVLSPSPVLAHVGRSVSAHGYASGYGYASSVTTDYAGCNQ